jgi:sugar/nucleoside kinase (ribokinase family)
VANVGGDLAGREIISALHNERVDSRYVRINPDKRTNYHYILWYKEERTILVRHEEYDYHWPNLMPDETPAWLYFSSISKGAIGLHDDLADWLEMNLGVKFAFQPGTLQIDLGAERLSRLYKRAEVLLVNREEAVELAGGRSDDLLGLFNSLHALGPKIAVITDGPDGAYASDGNQQLKMPAYPDPAPPLERTGAGDAFSAAFVAALANGNNVEGALQWAPINSMSVVQQVGSRAGLLTETQIEEYLKRAPEWYRPQALS